MDDAAARWVDVSAVVRVTGGLPGAFDRLRAVFLRILPVQLAEARSAVSAHNGVELRERAHTLVGTLSAFSTSAGEHARHLEDAAQLGDMVMCTALIDGLEGISRELLEEVVTLVEATVFLV